MKAQPSNQLSQTQKSTRFSPSFGLLCLGLILALHLYPTSSFAFQTDTFFKSFGIRSDETTTTPPNSIEGVMTIKANRIFMRGTAGTATPNFSTNPTHNAIQMLGATQSAGRDTIAIGTLNQITGGTANVVIGGNNNQINATIAYSTLLGGASNSVSNNGDFIALLGGIANQKTGNNSNNTIIGGQNNNVSANQSVILGGVFQSISSFNSASIATASLSLLGSGAVSIASRNVTGNNLSANWGTVFLGLENTNGSFGNNSYSVVAGKVTSAIGIGNHSFHYFPQSGTNTNSSYSFNYNSAVSHPYAAAIGEGLITSRWHQVVVGRFNNTSDTNSDAPNALFIYGNGTGTGSRSNAMTIRSTGRLWIAGTASATSDKRLKKDITPFTYGREALLALKPVHFKWERWDTDDVGLIAQEVYPIIPELVNKGDDEATYGWQNIKEQWSIQYEKLPLVLINAYEEQQAELKATDDKIAELKKRALELEARIQTHLKNKQTPSQ